MGIDTLLAAAWKAVKAAEVPEHLQETAFKEALAMLRDPETSDTSEKVKPKGKPKRPSASGTRKRQPDAATSSVEMPTDEEFYKRLADESGLDETQIRDVLRLTSDGRVQVQTPTRTLGSSVADQAKTVITLVSGARAKGLREHPVNAEFVRREVERKHCYQQNNFASKHLRPLKGFNAGDKNEILLTSKWVGEFGAAITQAHGEVTGEE